MDIQRILILMGLAVTAYMLVLAWNEDYGDRATPAPATSEVVTGTDEDLPPVTDALPTPAEDETVPAAGEVPATPEAAVAEKQAAPSAESDRFIRVETDVLEVLIDRRGGDVERAALPAFPERIDTPGVPFVLIDPRNDYAAQSGLIGPDGTDTAEGRPLFEVDRARYTLADDQDVLNVDLTWRQDGVTITKRYQFRRGDYLIDVVYLVDNESAEPWQAALYGQIKRDGDKPVVSDANSMGLQPYVGGATFQSDDPYTKLEFGDLEDEAYEATAPGGYMSMVQHYFLSAWIPGADQTHTYRARKLASRNTYLFEFTSPLQQIAPGESGTLEAQLYIGPKDQYRLAEITRGLDLTVDYGFLWWLAQPLFYLLTFIHGFVHNWGIAIILLTVIVKTALYPLSAASFRSMAKMRKLQPEMMRLKERYGDDRQQFSQAMMELYKKEGANPLGGCFPILLQMPVFLALYWTLLESVELRQAPFMLWINDLSDKDPYFVLPILMGISMFVTQMLQPEPPDPMQAKIFKLMPVMFTFFFLWFPAGLVLYWLVNNILSILQQWYVTRQIETKS